ncbi:GTR11 protein, partial [Pachyramphus minor]|nr:GTR11 protein [Pachyramphus minor]
EQADINQDEKVKPGSYPGIVCCCRKKCLLLNDVILIIATLHTGFSRTAKSFEMILVGRFLEGIGAGRTPHYSLSV